MRRLAFAALLALAGCPTPTPTPVPPLPAAASACPPTEPISQGICAGLFTSEHWPCFQCPGASGCYDQTDAVYCVSGACLDDPRCRTER